MLVLLLKRSIYVQSVLFNKDNSYRNRYIFNY